MGAGFHKINNFGGCCPFGRNEVPTYAGTSLRNLGQSQVDRRFAAVTASFDVESDLLVVFQASQAGTLNSRDVYEHVLGAAVRSDKAEAFSCVEPFLLYQ